MFYYPYVLQRRSGCFATIWLAATKGRKLTRRELLVVNVNKTCMDILNYITVQEPPLQNLPNPRFSLYLSSQLQYGVVVIYHRQCSYLLDEIQQIIDRLLRFKIFHIDMAKSDRLALDLPDNLLNMEQAEGAQDPFFGSLKSYQLPMPCNINQPGVIIEDLSLTPPDATSDAEGFTSPPVDITIPETEPVVITSAEHFEGADLPEVTEQELDLLINQQEHFHPDVEDHMNDERQKSRTLMSSVIDQLKDTMQGTHQDSVGLQDEETGQRVELPEAALPQVMTPAQVNMPSSQTEAEQEVVTRPVRRRSKRQLVFVDPDTQISSKEQKEQIENPLVETLNLSAVLLCPVSVTKRATSPAKLFNTLCGAHVHSDIKLLWKNSNFLTPLSGPEDDFGVQEDREEQDREITRDQRKRRHLTTKEIPSAPGQQPPEGSAVFDGSKEDSSVSDAITPISTRSPHEAVQQLAMEPIIEEHIEMPEAQTDTPSSGSLSWIRAHLQRSGEVTFDSLLPPRSNRSSVARTFYKLLKLLSAGQVKAVQAKPYDKIIINPVELGDSE